MTKERISEILATILFLLLLGLFMWLSYDNTPYKLDKCMQIETENGIIPIKNNEDVACIK